MTRSLTATDRLHVLLTTDVVGGVWDFCWTLSRELVAGGHRVTLLALGSPSAAHLRQARTAGADLLHAPFKLEWMQDSAADVQASRQEAARLLRALQPDVLHTNQYALADVPGAPDAPVVLTAHSDVLSWLKWVERRGADGPVPPEWRDYARIVRRGLLAADAVVAISRFVADDVRALYGLPRVPRVIHNGWRAPDEPALPLAARRRLTLLAGRAWDRAKNVQVVAEAAAGWPAGEVLLAGEQRHPETGTAVALPPAIVPLGPLPREALERTLREARVYLAPSLYEPFGLLPLQAALAGCALLLSDIPSFRELWDGAALFCQPDDPAEVRRQWRRLMEETAFAQHLAQVARDRARQRYTAARMTADYVGLYQQVVRQRRDALARSATLARQAEETARPLAEVNA